jgi:hypothetical protein
MGLHPDQTRKLDGTQNPTLHNRHRHARHGGRRPKCRICQPIKSAETSASSDADAQTVANAYPNAGAQVTAVFGVQI